MSHYSRLSMIVIDVSEADHDKEVGFWRAATGKALKRGERYPEYHAADLGEGGFGLLVQRLGDGPSRIHLDIHTDDLAAEVTRLEGLGAERVREVHGWQIMRDPAGLLFCVIPDTSGSLAGDGNAQRWE